MEPSPSLVDIWLKAIKDVGLPIALTLILLYYVLRVLSSKLDEIIKSQQEIMKQLASLRARLPYSRYSKEEDEDNR